LLQGVRGIGPLDTRVPGKLPGRVPG